MKHTMRLSIPVSLLVLALMLLGAPVQAGTTIVVDTTVDELNSDGDCSLREAIEAANTDLPVDACPAGSGADTINLPSGTYTLTSGSSLLILSSLTLSGPGADTTILEAAVDPFTADFGVMEISPASVSISGVTIRHGNHHPTGGGAIFSGANLILSDSKITRNNAGRFGGGIYNWGVLNVIRTTISDNSVDVGGGGILNRGTLVMIDSTISGNTTPPPGGSGAGIFVTGGGTASLTNVTLSGNNGYRGGAIENRGRVTLVNSTITNNEATVTGAGINHAFNGRTTLKNTIIANFDPGLGRLFPPGDCFDFEGGVTFTSLGNNLDGDGTCNLTEPTDLPNTDPLLGPLADNGGPTLTHALLPGSPAIDAGDDAACPDTDQRGVARPDGPACDIGAFELEQTIIVSIDIEPGSDPNSIRCTDCNQGRHLVAVAILTTPDFDATTVDHTTVTFEGATEAHVNAKGPRRHEEDVDGDGDTDLVLHFWVDETGLLCSSTEATLIGETFGGRAIEGTDAVNMVEGPAGS